MPTMPPVANYAALARGGPDVFEHFSRRDCATPAEWRAEINYAHRLSNSPALREPLKALAAFENGDGCALHASLLRLAASDAKALPLVARALDLDTIRTYSTRPTQPEPVLALFGASTFGQRAFAHLAQRHRILCFFDNDPAKTDRPLHNVPVLGFDPATPFTHVVVASMYSRDILLQLLRVGVALDDIVVIRSCDDDGLRAAEAALQHRSPPAPEPSAAPPAPAPRFTFDGLDTAHALPALVDQRFLRLFDAAVQDSPHLRERIWPLHVALFCARNALRLAGDFVECGVWHGYLATGILHACDWRQVDKTFHLVDTFRGIDESILTDEERTEIPLEHYRKYYADCFNAVTEKFRPWPNVKITRGSVPAVLPTIDIHRIAYLSIDMNNASAEIGALEHLWPLVVPGGYVLLDDYCYVGHETQRTAFDAFFAAADRPILALPTGQGLVIK